MSIIIISAESRPLLDIATPPKITTPIGPALLANPADSRNLEYRSLLSILPVTFTPFHHFFIPSQYYLSIDVHVQHIHSTFNCHNYKYTVIKKGEINKKQVFEILTMFELLRFSRLLLEMIFFPLFRVHIFDSRFKPAKKKYQFRFKKVSQFI